MRAFGGHDGLHKYPGHVRCRAVDAHDRRNVCRGSVAKVEVRHSFIGVWRITVLTFNDVLASAELDPRTVRLARHLDRRSRLRSIYAVWKTEPDLFEAYQAIQKARVWYVGDFVASFVVTPPPAAETLFVCLYKVESVSTCEAGATDPITGNDVSGCDRFAMTRDNRLDEYKGRLSIEWGPGARTWAQRASAQPKPIRAIRDQEEPPFPPVSEFCVDVAEVPALPTSWQARLAAIKGIYLLVDQRTGEQYVGSAKGEDSLPQGRQMRVLLVVEPGLQDDEVFTVDEIDEAVFFGDPPGPGAREHVP
jgi:hypothetical protein